MKNTTLFVVDSLFAVGAVTAAASGFSGDVVAAVGIPAVAALAPLGAAALATPAPAPAVESNDADIVNYCDNLCTYIDKRARMICERANAVKTLKAAEARSAAMSNNNAAINELRVMRAYWEARLAANTVEVARIEADRARRLTVYRREDLSKLAGLLKAVAAQREAENKAAYAAMARSTAVGHVLVEADRAAERELIAYKGRRYDAEDGYRKNSRIAKDSRRNRDHGRKVKAAMMADYWAELEAELDAEADVGEAVDAAKKAFVLCPNTDGDFDIDYRRSLAKAI